MKYRKTLPLALSAALVAGCATQSEPPQALTAASQAVAAAKQNPDVQHYAPLALRQAEQSLERAQTAWNGIENRDDTAHLAYLAERQARIAEALARRDATLAAGLAAADQGQSEALRRAQEQARLEAERARREAQSLQARLREAQQQLAEMQPQQTERGIVLTLDELLFAFNSAELKPGNERTLDRLAQYLRNNPGYQILVEGHTDAVGAEGYNQRLSEQRAEAVRNALARRGIGRDRVQSAGLGENYPVASNETNTGRAQNRRVEVVIAQDEMPPTRDQMMSTRDGRRPQG